MPSRATVLALVALFVALSGTAYAATKITGKEVRDGSLSGADLRNGSLTGADLRRGSIPADRIRGGLGAAQRSAPAGPQGPAGAAGPAGPAGPQGPAGPPAAAQPAVATFAAGAMLWEPSGTGNPAFDRRASSYTQTAAAAGVARASGVVPGFDLGAAARRRIASVDVCVDLDPGQRLDEMQLTTQGSINADGDRPEQFFIDDSRRSGPQPECSTITPPADFVLDADETLFVSVSVQHLTPGSFTLTQTIVRTVPA